MALSGLNPSPLNIDPEYPTRVRAQLARIMSAGVYDADELALIELKDGVSDALHLGTIDTGDHDTLCAEINDARMTLR